MKKNNCDAFASLHPINNFIYFFFVLIVSMFYRHPVLLVISVAAALAYHICLKGKRAVLYSSVTMLPVILFSIVINPLFSHEGMTILGYFSTGNPITLESIFFGMASGLMITAVLFWFYGFHKVMESDKLMYLFGRVIPAMSLLLSMIFRFVPRYKTQIKRISNAQKGIGRDVKTGSLWQRIRHGMTILSVMVTWAFENSIETADSMKARGYGLRGRNNYVRYHFGRQDIFFAVTTIALFSIVMTGILSETLTIQYYPIYQMNPLNIVSGLVYLAYALLCFAPVLLDWMEEWKWHRLQSEI